MISSIAFVLYLGKLSSWIYNLIMSKSKDKQVDNSYERRNVCRKTANANFIEMITYGLITIIAFIIGV